MASTRKARIMSTPGDHIIRFVAGVSGTYPWSATISYIISRERSVCPHASQFCDNQPHLRKTTVILTPYIARHATPGKVRGPSTSSMSQAGRALFNLRILTLQKCIRRMVMCSHRIDRRQASFCF